MDSDRNRINMAGVSDYDYKEFWKNAPDDAHHVPPLPTDPRRKPEHARQEEALLAVLRRHQMYNRLRDSNPPASIFEAGCGAGRLAYLFAQHFPEARYDAIDLNAECVKATYDVRPDAGDISVGDIITYDTTARWEDPDFEGYDLVIASEVLMHVPPEHVEQAFSNLLQLVSADKGRLITVDWVPLPGEVNRLKRTRAGIAPWNFPHPYERMFKTCTSLLSATRTDRQVIYVLKP